MTWNEATIEEPLARDFLGAILGTTSARCMHPRPINRIPLGLEAGCRFKCYRFGTTNSGLFPGLLSAALVQISLLVGNRPPLFE
jgi:hypothetical protein